MAKKPTEEYDANICLDVSNFRDYIQRLRKIDDTIINNLNAAVSNLEKASQQQNVQNCTSFNQQLEDAYHKRDRLINFCVASAQAKVDELREAKDKNDSDESVHKEFKRHQNRLRSLRSELMVEESIRQRSLKALHEKCRRYILL